MLATSRKETHNGANRDAQTTNARFTPHNGGIDCNSVDRLHKLSPCVFRLKRLAILRATLSSQSPGTGQAGHLLVQGQDFQAGPVVVVGDEAIEEARAGGSLQGCPRRTPVERRDESTSQHVQQAGAGVGLGYAVMVLYGYVCLTDDLVRGEDFRAAISNQLG